MKKPVGKKTSVPPSGNKHTSVPNPVLHGNVQPILNTISAVPKKQPTITVKNIESLVNKESSANSSNNVPSKKEATPITPNAVPSSKNEVLNASNSDKTKCNCMRYIKLYCSKCDMSSFYRKDLTQCMTCKTLLKLQCSQCFKRYAYLSSVHQYLLQFTKRRNLLNDNKDVKFTCLKKRYYWCSKCHFSFLSKEKLDLHVNIHHREAPPQVPPKVESVSNKVDKFSLYPKFAEEDYFIKLPCKICNVVTNDLLEYTSGKPKCRTCNQDMLFECALCYKPYVTLRNARRHVVDCFVCLDMMSCHHCTFKTREKSVLLAHINFYHMPDECSNCKEKFENAQALAAHKVIAKCLPKWSKADANAKIVHLTPKEVSKVTVIEKVNDSFTKVHPYLMDDAVEEEMLQSDMKSFHSDQNYLVVDRDPASIIQQITSQSQKESGRSDWNYMVDYYCQHCQRYSMKQSSDQRPTCQKCKHKYDYRCTLCGLMFTESKAIYLHVKNECNPKNKMVCQLCSFYTTRKHILFTHIKTYHTIYKCLRCNCNYAGYRCLMNHLYKCTANQSVLGDKHVEKLIAMYCTKCNKNINARLQKVTGKPICPTCTCLACYQCLKCKNIYANHKYTYKHVKELCQPKYACAMCKFKAYVAQDLEVHVNFKHTIWKCSYCALEFKDEHTFKVHRRNELKQWKNQDVVKKAQSEN
ncbi:PR domain zinc finger protein 5-like [Copidosoma floridanum]|uniref:PR domain zinc finger protein 5-like n=1 Tax=Copidosoma floridanum TaxID=29053 RepID=UPI000C6FA310|nr:PR domain zinc finger protein 5-like [Copidosoma floridanum]